MSDADRTADAAPPVLSRLETLTAVGVVGVLALLLGVLTLAMSPTTTETQEIEYTQQGEFSYTADTSEGSVYGADGLSTGEPIIGDVTGPVTARFDYRFESDAVSDVQGTGELKAVVTLVNGLSRTFPVTDDVTFRGDRVTLSGVLPIGAISEYVERASAVVTPTGVAGATVRLVSEVTLDGALDGRVFDATFGPELTFSQQGNTLTPAEPVTDVEATTDPLKPSEPGSVKFDATIDNTVPVPIVEPPVRPTMMVAFLVAGVSLLLGLLLARPLRAGSAGGEAARIAALYGSLLVEVRGLSAVDGPIADVVGIEPLVDVAKKYESVIMHVTGDHGDDYLVWDSGMVYRYRSLHSSAGQAAESDQGDADGAEPLLREATRWKKRNPS